MTIKVVYSESYEIDIGVHVFPTVKFRLIRERLIKDKILKANDFVEAPQACNREILLVHTRLYLDKLAHGTLSPEEISALELPYSPALVSASRICVGGTILTSRFALRGGVSIHLGGGFHHAFPDHGEGFCVLNDVACAAKFCYSHKLVERIMIVDCDLHQGNGNAYIFKDVKNVFTFSIHQENNYPAIKPPSDLDIGLPDGVGDEKYLDALKKNLPAIFKDFQPQLIFYIAGADPYCKDQLGGLNISLEGLRRRDEFIFSLAKKNRIPIAVVLGGGYALEIEDTVIIHYNMVKEAQKAFI